jgi:cysteine synthase B
VEKNVFSGPNAAMDRLEFDNLPTPALIEVAGALNPLRSEEVLIYAKVMPELPWSQIKMIAAKQMLEAAFLDGDLEGVHTLVEATSGNTGSALAVLASFYDIKNVVVVVPRDIAPGKLNRLIVEGARPEFYDKGETGVAKAKSLGKQKGWFNLGQYDSSANVEAHQLVTAAQIYHQLGNDLTIVSAGIGTAGTAVGCKQFFDGVRAQNSLSNTAVLGVLCAPGEDAIPGIRTEERLREISIPWQELENLETVTVKEAYLTSLNMLRSGIEAGPSSGAALAGGLKFLTKLWEKNSLGRYRNEKGEVVMVVICPDNHLPYLDKYSTHMGTSEGF